jgi:hypothetical protein
LCRKADIFESEILCDKAPPTASPEFNHKSKMGMLEYRKTGMLENWIMGTEKHCPASSPPQEERGNCGAPIVMMELLENTGNPPSTLPVESILLEGVQVANE